MDLELDRVRMLRAAVIAAVVGLATAAGLISNDALLSHGAAAGRSLLQTKKDCPVTFEGANYTLITSRCKGPLYQPALCCTALADFACPYSIYINDVSTNCASNMFSLIHIYGKYPTGLFANTCKGDTNGIKCPDDVPQVQPGQEGKSSAAIATAAQAALVAACAVAFSLFIVLS
uniref:Uncharacterized protein n=1 Tax=Avena sativa TaxID=4498 RepID=A0ACD5Z5Y3_AVESA